MDENYIPSLGETSEVRERLRKLKILLLDGTAELSRLRVDKPAWIVALLMFPTSSSRSGVGE